MVETKNFPLIGVEDYARYIGDEAVERIMKKAKLLYDYHVVNVNSTMYGGGVAVILTSLTLLMNKLGIKTGWRVIQGMPDYFGVTKKMHNALQGDTFNLTQRKKDIYESVVYENSLRMHIDHDAVIIHDPQPLPIINHYRKRGPWIWRCHIDLTEPNPTLWNYLLPFIEKYDAAIFSLKEYAHQMKTPPVFCMPAIDPFDFKNRDMSDEEVDERLANYNIPTDLPLVVQVSRFDPWKDPKGVIDAFKAARKQVPCRLILLGNVATDDPEGVVVYESLLKERDDTVMMLTVEDTALVNALQRKAAVVIQKSIKEGFGLTVTEAMWKGTPAIGGNVGGIRYQIKDGENGYLVNNVEECADRMVTLLKDEDLQRSMGEKARQSVKDNFLMTRLLEQYLDLFLSFKTDFRLMQ